MKKSWIVRVVRKSWVVAQFCNPSTMDAERQRIMKQYREGEGESREFSKMDKASWYHWKDENSISVVGYFFTLWLFYSFEGATIQLPNNYMEAYSYLWILGLSLAYF